MSSREGRVRWRCAGRRHGQRLSRSFDRKADADRWDTESVWSAPAGKYPRKLSKSTVSAVLDNDWLAWQAGEGREHDLPTHQRPAPPPALLDGSPPSRSPSDSPRRDRVAMPRRHDKASPIERNRANSPSACLSWAADRELIEVNPDLGIRASREPKPSATP